MKIAVVGAGGFGKHYTNFLLENRGEDIEFTGVIEKYYDTCSTKEAIDEAGIPVYATLEDFYKENTADLVLIATPPFLHCEQSICALEHGAYVLCEKPAAPTPAEVEAMIEAQRKYGKWIAIGYQWSYAENIKRIKRDILDGRFGKPLSFKTFASWPRTKAYYARGGGWGGRISKDGITVLDSIASNACAHHVENMLFLLGDKMDTTAKIAGGRAETLRANHIENFDTCVIRAVTESGVPLSFYGSHATDISRGPDFVLEFEKATIRYVAIPKETTYIVATFKDGTEINYGEAPAAGKMDKIAQCIEAVKNGTHPICDINAAAEHIRLIGRIYENVQTHTFPTELIHESDEAVCVEGLYDKLAEAYASDKFLCDVGYTFSKSYDF